MTKPVLYSFRRCPYAMRGRMAIVSSGIQVELRELVLRDKPLEMLEASPKGTVPVVVLQDGTVLEESLDVAFWALRANDPEGWLEPWTTGDVEADALIAENDGPFKHHLDRYKYSTRYRDADPEEHRAGGEAFLARLDMILAGQAHLAGNRFTFLDAAIAPFIRQFRIADPDWFDSAPYPNLQDWLARFLDDPRFTKVMNKYPLWTETRQGHAFPG